MSKILLIKVPSFQHRCRKHVFHFSTSFSETGGSPWLFHQGNSVLLPLVGAVLRLCLAFQHCKLVDLGRKSDETPGAYGGYSPVRFWRFPKMEVPPNHPKLDNFSTEIYGFGDPPCYETSI